MLEYPSQMSGGRRVRYGEAAAASSRPDIGLADDLGAPAWVPAHKFSRVVPCPCLEAECPCKLIPVVRLAFLKPLFVLRALCAESRHLSHETTMSTLPPFAVPLHSDFLQRAHRLLLRLKDGKGDFPNVARLERVRWNVIGCAHGVSTVECTSGVLPQVGAGTASFISIPPPPPSPL